MSEREWIGSPTTASAWTALASPSETGIVRLAFSDATDRLALASQLERWRAALARVQADVLVLPDVVYDGSAVVLTFPSPAVVGANLPDPHTLKETIERLAVVAEALDALHEAGLVHGALAGHSLWWSTSGRLRFPDAGLANALEGVVGPPAEASPYRAPEFWHGQPRSRFSDQYALAVMAYEWLTGHKREVDHTLEGVTAIEPLMLEPQALRSAGAPLQFADVLQRALSFTATARYPTCSAFVAELKAYTDKLWSPDKTDRRKRQRSKLALPGWRAVLSVGAALLVLVLLGANADSVRRAATFSWLKRMAPMTRVEVRPRSTSTAPARTPEQMLRGALPQSNRPEAAPGGQTPSKMARDSSRPVAERGSLSSAPPPTVVVDVKDATLDATRLLKGASNSPKDSTAAARAQGTANGRIADSRTAASVKSPAVRVPTLIIGDAKAADASGGTATKSATGTTARVDPQAPAVLLLTVPSDSRVYVDGVLIQNKKQVAVAAGSHDITVLTGDTTIQKRVSLAAGDTVRVRLAMP